MKLTAIERRVKLQGGAIDDLLRSVSGLGFAGQGDNRGLETSVDSTHHNLEVTNEGDARAQQGHVEQKEAKEQPHETAPETTDQSQI
jgi:hypothetical protein